MKRVWSLISIVLLFALVLTSCAPAATPPPEPTAAPKAAASDPTKAPAATAAPAATKAPEPTKAPAPTAVPAAKAPAAAAKKFVTWFQYDERNIDPKADERVGNEYLRKTIPLFNKALDGKWTWENQFTPWDKIAQQLTAAVQSKGDVPDLVEMGTGTLNQYHKNGVFQDLTEWAKTQKWWSDMDPAAAKACTGPDGKLYCIPMAERPAVVYVWKDRFPNGFPKTPEEFLKEAERIKNDKSGAPKDKYGMTFFGSTDFDGDGTARAVWTILSSFGGGYDDGKGKMLLNTPENVEAIKFIRNIVQNKYVPEIAFAGKFQEEEAFKDSSAGSFPTGLFGYRYVNPLSAPSGKKYEKKTQDDMLDAIAAGDVILAPMFAPAGKKPGCDINAPALAIPVGAKNADGAKELINWVLAPEQNPDYVLGPGAGFPVLKSYQSDAKYQTPFYKQASAAVNASVCRPWAGSIVDTAGAKKAIMSVVYKLIKQDPTADIAAELQKTQDAFNKAQ